MRATVTARACFNARQPRSVEYTAAGPAVRAETPVSAQVSSSSEDQTLVPRKVQRLAVITLVTTIVLDFIGFGMILPVLPYFAEDYGASATEVTLLSALFSVSQFIMAPVLGRLSDRHGRRPIMLVSVAGATVAPLVLGLAESLIVIFIARLVSGASKSNISTAQAAIADMVPATERAKYMGLTGAAIGIGFVLGPTFGGMLAMGGDVRVPFFASALLSAVNFVMVWRWLPETRWLRRDALRARKAAGQDVDPNELEQAEGQVARPRPRFAWQQMRALRGSPLMLLYLATFIVFMSFALMESTFALFNQAIFDWGAFETGTALGGVGVVMVVVQGGMVGRWSKKYGEARSLYFGIFSMALGMAALGGLPDLLPAMGIALLRSDGSIAAAALAWYAVATLVMCAGNAVVMANSTALVSLLSSPSDQGANMGLKESTASLGRIAGPAVAGPIFQFVGPGAPMVLGGLVGLVAAFAAVVLRGRVRGLGNERA